jgi:hypothetical protein
MLKHNFEHSYLSDGEKESIQFNIPMEQARGFLKTARSLVKPDFFSFQLTWKCGKARSSAIALFLVQATR